MERIRDVQVAEEIAAQAGTDQTPELMLGDVLTPVIFGPQRPPLAQSGYFPGTAGIVSAAVALNTSHAGLFISGFGGAIGRINWIRVHNASGGGLGYSLRRLDAPFTGFPSVRLSPAYINAGNPTTGRAYSITKSDTVGANGVLLAFFEVGADQDVILPGPWVLNDGALLVSCNTVNTIVRFQAGYESWTAIRPQPPG